MLCVYLYSGRASLDDYCILLRRWGSRAWVEIDGAELLITDFMGLSSSFSFVRHF